MDESPTAVLVAAFDSQLKWCARLRDELELRGVRCSAVAPADRITLSPDQVRAAGFDAVTELDWDDLVQRCVTADVVVCALAGPQVRRLTLALAAPPSDAPGPVVVAGWVGVIIEKITAGYLDRAGADVVAVNARHELEHFRHVAARLDLPEDNLVLSGLPFLSSSPAPARGGPIRTVVFADQPTVPQLAGDRLHLYRRLVAHARRHPERTVLLKPRHRPGEDTFHRMRHHPDDLLAGEPLPANFHVDYTPVAELLPRTDLLVTMSSTAFLEALDHGVRVALVLDLGVHERFGNQVLLDSGLLRTFDQIDADDLGEVEPDFLDSFFGGRDRSPAQVVVDRAEKLLATGERPSRSVWDAPYLRAAAELQAAREGGHVPPLPGVWARRRRRHGRLKGTAVHVATLLLPPLVARPARRWWRARHGIRS